MAQGCRRCMSAAPEVFFHQPARSMRRETSGLREGCLAAGPKSVCELKKSDSTSTVDKHLCNLCFSNAQCQPLRFRLGLLSPGAPATQARATVMLDRKFLADQESWIQDAMSIYLSFYFSLSRSIHFLVYLSVFPVVFRSIHLSNCLSAMSYPIHLSTHSCHPSVYLVLHLSIENDKIRQGFLNVLTSQHRKCSNSPRCRQYSLTWQRQKQSNSARLPPVSKLATSKPKPFCETSFRNGKLSAELTVSVKCCTCHAKVMTGHTKCCTCHAKSS